MNLFAAFILPAVSRDWLAKAYQKTRLTVFGRGGRGESFSLLAAELKDISVTSEDGFLAIGERLMDFQQRATAISAVVNAMVDQLQSGRGATARADLAGILNILQRTVTTSTGGGAQHSLRLLMERVDQVSALFTGFSQMTRQLKLFGTSIKIECAHMGDRAGEIASLPDHVAGLSDEVSRKAAAVFGRREAVTATLQNALATATAMANSSRESVAAILEKTRRNLQDLTTMARHCATAAGTIASTSDEVAVRLGEVVVSLQTHDMVHQQVQHVAEALDELAGRWTKPAAGPGTWFAPDRSVLLLETGKLCTIQAAQLDHSATALAEAVAQIIAALQGVMAQERRLAAETADLLGTDGVAGTPIFTEMGLDLHGVIGVLIATAAANQQMADSLVSVTTTVDEIVHCAADIDAIAYDIKFVALNAQIQTASMGSEGNSLGVLAGAIQQLSVAARDQAEGVSLVLDEIKAMTVSLHATARGEAASMETKFEEMRRILEEVLAALRTMNDDITAGLTGAGSMVEALAADIEAACASITVHHRLTGVLDKVKAVLDGISQEVMGLVPSEAWAADSLSVADRRYTMHSERDVHAGVVRGLGESEPKDDGLAAAPPVATEAGASGPGQEFGDNVELF